jgi:exosome complex component RRP4
MTAAKEKSTLLVKDKDVVTPGEVLAEGMEYLPSQGTYRKDERIYANQTGLLTIEGKVLKTIPLAGGYMPRKYDVVIGKVIDILMTGWRLDINCPYSAVLPLKDATFDYIKKGADLTSFFDLDEYVVCKIIQVTSQNLIDVSMKGPGLKKLSGGRIIKVNAAKVPRLIGKRGSMVSMLKNATKCDIVVGQNGRVWLTGEPKDEILAVTTIRKIEREGHVPGLTERIQQFLSKETGTKVEIPEVSEEDEERYERRPPREDRRDGDRRDSRPPRRDGDRRDNRPPRRDGDRRDNRPPRRDGDRRDGGRRDDRNDGRARSRGPRRRGPRTEE